MRKGAAILMLSSTVAACAGGPSIQTAPAIVPANLSNFTKGENRLLSDLLGPTSCPFSLTSPDGAIRLMRFRVARSSAARTVTVGGRDRTTSAPTQETGDYRVLPASAWQMPAGHLLQLNCATLDVRGTLREE
jgi:hypothetical protein